MERFTVPNDPNACWIWEEQSRNKDGYGAFGRKNAHRWLYEYLHGPLPKGLVCDHICRNRACVNPNHIEPVTVLENTRRGLNVGNKWNRGTGNGQAKLDETQVRAIRDLAKTGAYTHHALAERFAVTQSVVTNIVNHKTWRHVQ